MNSGDVEITPTQYDTGDLIYHKPTQSTHMVACAHGHFLHTAGFPEQRLLTGDCILRNAASLFERKQHLESMAKSTSKGHRAECARTRLAEIITEEAFADPCYYED